MAADMDGDGHPDHIRAKADVEAARILLEQAKEFPERKQIAERFMRRMDAVW